MAAYRTVGLVTFVDCRDCTEVWVQWGDRFCRRVARLPLPPEVLFRRQFHDGHGVVEGQEVDVLGMDLSARRTLVQPVTMCSHNHVCGRQEPLWVDSGDVVPGEL